MPAWPRALLAAVVLVAGLVVFRLVQLGVDAPVRGATALDQAIPFLPWTLWCYLAFFLYVPTVAALAPAARFLPSLLAATVALAVAIAAFLLCPAACVRPPPTAAGDGVEAAIFGFIQRRDAAQNSFPSLHVAVTWILWRALGGTRWSAPGAIVAAAISVSTLTTKQHHLVDVAGGAALAVIACAVAERIVQRYGRPDLTPLPPPPAP